MANKENPLPTSAAYTAQINILREAQSLIATAGHKIYEFSQRDDTADWDRDATGIDHDALQGTLKLADTEVVRELHRLEDEQAA